MGPGQSFQWYHILETVEVTEKFSRDKLSKNGLSFQWYQIL